MSARSLVSAPASRTYDRNATKRPSPLIDAEGASAGRAWRSPCAIVRKLADPSAGTRALNASSPSASATTSRPPAVASAKAGSELAPALPEDFTGDLAAGRDRAFRFEASRMGKLADAGPRPGRHRREIHAIELL